MSLRGKTVVITGGTGALGAGVVGRLLDAGADCHIPYAFEAELDTFPHRDRDHVKLFGLVDLQNEEEVRAYYDGLPDLWASVHLVGGFHEAPIGETAAQDFIRQFQLNALTCFLCCREAVRRLRREEGGGRIVNVSAYPGIEPAQGAGKVAYTAAKAGVRALTMALAEEVAADGILVNAIAPAMIDTPANRKAMPDADFSQWTAPEAIGRTVAFLVSEENSCTRGAVLPV